MNFIYNKKGNYWDLGETRSPVYLKITKGLNNSTYNGRIYINGEIVKDIFEESSEMIREILGNELLGIYKDIGELINDLAD